MQKLITLVFEKNAKFLVPKIGDNRQKHWGQCYEFKNIFTQTIGKIVFTIF
jgi:hypothetical protein